MNYKNKKNQYEQALVVRSGWTGHTPIESSDLFASLLESRNFSVDISNFLEIYEYANQSVR